MDLIFDTETTGLESTRRLVEIAWELRDHLTGDLHEIGHYIIKSDGYVIPNARFHGITDEIAMIKGVTIDIVLTDFLRVVDLCDNLVAHNIKFDYDTILFELSKTELVYDKFVSKNRVCTLGLSREKHGRKVSNKLGDVYRRLFNKEFDAHKAQSDTLACSQIYY